jgi:hypothetical protein
MYKHRCVDVVDKDIRFLRILVPERNSGMFTRCEISTSKKRGHAWWMESRRTPVSRLQSVHDNDVSYKQRRMHACRYVR